MAVVAKMKLNIELIIMRYCCQVEDQMTVLKVSVAELLYITYLGWNAPFPYY